MPDPPPPGPPPVIRKAEGWGASLKEKGHRIVFAGRDGGAAPSHGSRLLLASSGLGRLQGHRESRPLFPCPKGPEKLCKQAPSVNSLVFVWSYMMINHH